MHLILYGHRVTYIVVCLYGYITDYCDRNVYRRMLVAGRFRAFELFSPNVGVPGDGHPPLVQEFGIEAIDLSTLGNSLDEQRATQSKLSERGYPVFGWAEGRDTRITASTNVVSWFMTSHTDLLRPSSFFPSIPLLRTLQTPQMIARDRQNPAR